MARRNQWIRNTAVVTAFAMLGVVATSAHANDRLAPRHALPSLDFYSALDTSTDIGSATDTGTITATGTGSDSSTDTGTITDTSTDTGTSAVSATTAAPSAVATVAEAVVGKVAEVVVGYILRRLFNAPSLSDAAAWREFAKETRGQRDAFVDIGR